MNNRTTVPGTPCIGRLNAAITFITRCKP